MNVSSVCLWLNLPRCLELWAWLRANPLWGIIAALLAGLGASGLHRAYLKARVQKADRQAVRARVRLKVAEATTRLDELHAKGRALDEATVAAQVREEEATVKAEDVLERRKRLADKYRKIGPAGSVGPHTEDP